MKITKKQREEIDFLASFSTPFKPTEEEIGEYIVATVHGRGSEGKGFKNRLFQSKRSLDIMIKMWRKDIKEGLLYKGELDFKHPYFKKILKKL